MKTIEVAGIPIGNKSPLAAILGPCVIESEIHALHMAEKLKKIAVEVGIPLIYKSSYDKANRSSFRSFRGVGQEEGLKILEKVRREIGLPITSDVHTAEEALIAKEVLDLVQIPAFLCRQTDILFAAAGGKAAVSIKKGQFLSPWEMKNVVKKVEEGGTSNILLMERGTSFGYNNLVVDMRSFPIMQETGYPTCIDATHAVQLPGARGDQSGGDRRYIPLIARSSIASGACSALFMECHDDPEKALSDRETQLPIEQLADLLRQLKGLHQYIQNL